MYFNLPCYHAAQMPHSCVSDKRRVHYWEMVVCACRLWCVFITIRNGALEGKKELEPAEWSPSRKSVFVIMLMVHLQEVACLPI